jgi:translocation and assembly module TamB
MLRRITWSVTGLLLAALAFSVTAFMVLGYTEAAPRFVFERLPERIGRTTLRAEGFSGTLAGGFRLQRFTLEHELVSLRVEGATGRIAMLPLLWQTIDARELRVEFARAEIKRRKTPPPKREPRFLPRFLSIVADDIRIARAEVVLINGFLIATRDLRASGVARHKTIHFTDSAVDIGGVLQGGGTALLTAGAPLALEGATRWRWAPVGQPAWVATADVKGDLDRLPASVRITSPLSATAEGELLDLRTRWNWRADARINDFDLRAWGAGGALGRITGQLALRGDRDGFSARGPLDSAGLGAGPFDTLFEGNWVRGVLRADRIRLVHEASRSTIDARGEIQAVRDGPRLGLEGDWSGLRWPLTGAAPAIRNSAGSFTLAGVWPYALTAAGRFQQPALDLVVPLNLRGRLARDHLAIDSAAVSLYQGTAALSGEVRWSPGEAWRLEGSMRGLDPAAIRPALPGNLGFDFEVSGDDFGSAATIDARFRNIDGQLRGAAARGRGRIVLQGERWQFDGVSVAAGSLRVAADGSLAPGAVNLDFRLDADDLGILSAGSRGSLSSRGTIAGTTAQPIVRATANGSDIEVEGLRLRRLDADIDFDPRAGRSSNVRIDARGLEFSGRTLATASLGLRGRSEQNTLTLTAAASNGRVAAQADGGFDGTTWRGQWREFNVDDDANLHLKLDQAAALRLSTSAGRLERVCLRGDQARLCAEADWDAAQWRSAVSATRMPIAALTAGLTPRLTYEGTLDIEASLNARNNGPLLGTARAELSDAQLRRRRANGREDVIPLGSGRFTAEASAETVVAELDLDAGAAGRIRASANAQRTTDDFAAMPLRASLRATTGALGIINLWVPEIDRAAGRLELDLAVGGTLGAPSINGIARVENGELDLYQINLALRETQMEARLLDNGITFRAAASAGTGKLASNGSLSWREGQPRGQLVLKGENLLLVNVPEARIKASPDLTFRVDGRQLTIDGEVVIPEAAIAPADLTGAVLSSSDEIIVGEIPRDPDQTFTVTSRVRMVLGERVTLDSFGLSGRLTGSLTADTGVDGISRGTGELAVADGKYAALGRRLDIQRGRLIFSGGLLADPGVDLRAQKQFPDVIAGVNVRGTLRAPRMTFFSEPSLPQSQIVSLILAGGTFESAQSTDRDAGSRRGEVLAQGGAIIAQQLGQKVGIEDVSIEQDLSNETSLVLGKYLSPRLYVSYGISLAESINTIKLRYTLGDRWTLRTEAGQERSAEVVYTIEK